MENKLLKTKDSVVLFVIRIVLALLVIPHGLQKLFGWFDGYGFEGTIDFFAMEYGVWPVITIPLILIESVGMVFLLFGFWSRVWAVGAGLIFLTAMFVPHQHVNFYLDIIGIESGGIVFQIVVLLFSAAISYWGAGKWSVDAYWYKNQNNTYFR